MKPPLQTVDLDKTIKDKNPKLYNILPKFVLNYIKRIAHQNDVNHILTTLHDYQGLEFVEKLLEMLNITYTVQNPENFPPNGRYVFASNHPLGGLDGIVLLDIIGKQYGEVKFVVNDLLMNLKPLQSVFVPVNKHGSQSGEYIRKIDELYSSNMQVLYFPAGLCSRKINGEIIDPEWKKSFATKAIKYERDIVPVHFEGRNSNFFYNLALIRKKLGIKINLEMFYLADELFKQRGSHFKITIKEPISRSFLQTLKPADAVAFVRASVYQP